MVLRLLHYSDIEFAYDDPERIGRLAGSIESLRDDDTLVVGTGDNIGPSVLSIATDGRQAVDLFEAIRPDVSTFGNHDLDFGVESMLTAVRESPQTWVCANVSSGGQRLGHDAGIVPSTVLSVGGRSVGFFGLLDPETESTSPVSADLSIAPPRTVARNVTHELRDNGADYVVALAHTQGIEGIAEAVDIDVILAGHVHTERLDRVEGTLLSRPGVGGEFLNEVTLTDDGWTGRRLSVEEFPADDDVADAFRHRLPEAYTQTIGTLSLPLDRSADVADATATHAGHLVAEAYRWKTGADVGLQHGGGVHTGQPLTGSVTVADLVGTIPYEDPVSVVEVTGAQLERILAGFVAESDGPAAYLSGVTVERDGDGTPVTRIDGSKIDGASTYTLATTEFLLDSDPIFSVLDEENSRTPTSGPQYTVLVEYARSGDLERFDEGA